MFLDVVDLWDFYGTPMGRVARRMIRRRIRTLWPDVTGMTVVGLGYATPYMRPFRDEADRVMGFMPAGQGVLQWPPGGPGGSVLVNESELPLPDLSVDRLLLVHALEHTEQIRPMLRECWRVLSGNGRMMVIVPNRRGIWSRSTVAPFGHGHPFTRTQMSVLLRDNMFTPLRSEPALFVPPSSSRLFLTSAPAWENLGRKWLERFAGVHLFEAGKQLYATSAPTPISGMSSRRRGFAEVAGQSDTNYRSL